MAGYTVYTSSKWADLAYKEGDFCFAHPEDEALTAAGCPNDRLFSPDVYARGHLRPLRPPHTPPARVLAGATWRSKHTTACASTPATSTSPSTRPRCSARPGCAVSTRAETASSSESPPPSSTPRCRPHSHSHAREAFAPTHTPRLQFKRLKAEKKRKSSHNKKRAVPDDAADDKPAAKPKRRRPPRGAGARVKVEPPPPRAATPSPHPSDVDSDVTPQAAEVSSDDDAALPTLQRHIHKRQARCCVMLRVRRTHTPALG